MPRMMAHNKGTGRWSALFDNEEFCSIFDLSDSSIDASFDTSISDSRPALSGSRRAASLITDDSDSHFDTKQMSHFKDTPIITEEPGTTDLQEGNEATCQENVRDYSAMPDNRIDFGKSNSSYSVESDHSKPEHSSEDESSGDDLQPFEQLSSDERQPEFSTPVKPISKTKFHESILLRFSHVTKSLQKSVGKSKSLSVKPFSDQIENVTAGVNRNLIDSCQDWSSSLLLTLNHSEGLKQFQQHLESECSTENLKFWLDCQRLKQLSGKSFVKRVIEMYGLYFNEDSPMELNVDIKIKLEIANSIIRKPNRTCFDKALDHVFKLMERDSFPRFQAAVQLSKNSVQATQDELF
ncbi:uncharacterized protein LOC142357656 [Convolutriloba macropyga]|uniref:uncharacterized protein LOC142357656 n=1 Tax=Convolutriloba macropyga TaxID=536237 RepID=UPI003F5268B9